MLIGFIAFICAGHFYLSLMIIWLNFAIFNEILSLKRNFEKELKFPHFWKLNWYFSSFSIL
jgi:hypothetical protein